MRPQMPLLSSPSLPAHFRLLNRAERGLRALGIGCLPFKPDLLLKIAEKQAGINDFAEDSAFREALSVLCRSAENDASLTLVGRMSIRRFVGRALVNRLRRVHMAKQQPEIATTVLEPPLIVVGLPRSGTTFLHHMLTLDAKARPLLFWELIEPIPGPGPDRRREQLIAMLADMKRMGGNLDAKHHFDSDNPEECMLLLDSTLVSLSFWTFAPVYEYLSWFRQQDQREPYRAYKWLLQFFQRQSPNRRLTLKAPAHTGALASLLDAIPNARIVQTHRDPAEVVPSLNSLIYSLHSLVTDKVDVARMSNENMAHLEYMIARNEAARLQAPRSVLDINYAEIFRDPLACVRRIYDHFGLELDESFAERIRRFAANRPKEKYGIHSYSAEDFGTTKAAIRERFSAYHRRYIEDGPGHP